jgi:hypothetical protein
LTGCNNLCLDAKGSSGEVSGQEESMYVASAMIAQSANQPGTFVELAG